MAALFRRWITLSLLALAAVPVAAEKAPISLNVDASNLTGKIVHATLHIPAKPGPLTLYYPKWIPGTHAPLGPVTDLGNLHITALGQTLEWHRQPGDMYSFTCTVPKGADAVDVSLDYLAPAKPLSDDECVGAVGTGHLGVVNWSAVLLYPAKQRIRDVPVEASLRVPEGWRWATALPVERANADYVRFQPVSAETLVDSPVLLGENFRTIPLTDTGEAPVFLDLAADDPESLDVDEARIEPMRRLVKEADALFGAGHFRGYHFLVIDASGAFVGLEHHECSLDSAGARQFRADAGPFPKDQISHTLPHEFAHSWCGKYRRPAGHITSDFQEPLDNSLLWVYEGLTNYLGDVLAARSGMHPIETMRDDFAAKAYSLDTIAGRTWRPLSDTAVGAEAVSYRVEWRTLRRGQDYYDEGTLIWLEADTMIRQASGGERSLDDFCRAFFGGTGGKPEVVPFTFSDVVRTLNRVQPFDWETFFRTRLESTDTHAPIGGIRNAGWTLASKDEPSESTKVVAREWGASMPFVGLRFATGRGNVVTDVYPDSPAAKAGLCPGVEIIAVDGRRFTPEVLMAALKAAAKRTEAMEVIAANGDMVRTYEVDYHGGPQYPYLARDESKQDLLAEIFEPTSAKAASAAASAPQSLR